MDYKMDSVLFSPDGSELFITEFGRSRSSDAIVAPAQIRNYYILHFVVKGTVHLGDFDVVEGGAFLLACKKVHSFTFEPGFDHYWFGFAGSGAEKLLQTFNIPLTKDVPFIIKDFEKVKKFIESLYPSFVKSRSGNEALGVFLYCLSHLKRYKKNDVTKSYVEKATEYINNNYHNPISMENVAQNVNVSEKHLCRLFKKIKGTTPHKYLTETRMNIAKKLLKETDLPISEIAENVGFVSQFAFATAYKKHYGITPTNERHRKDG